MGIIRAGPVNLEFSIRKARETGEHTTVERRKTKITEGAEGKREIRYDILTTEEPWYERHVAGTAVLRITENGVYIRPLDRSEPNIRTDLSVDGYSGESKMVYVKVAGTLRFLGKTYSLLPNTWEIGEPVMKIDELEPIEPLISLAGVPLFGFYKTA